MNRNRIILAAIAVVVLVISSILLLGNTPANAGKGKLCASTALRISADTPRSTFVEIFGSPGPRDSFRTRGQLIVVKTEVRSWVDCGVRRSFTFTKIGDGVWTLA